MKAGSRNIYYLCAPNRHLAEHSPYFEAMKKKDMEVGEQWCHVLQCDVIPGLSFPVLPQVPITTPLVLSVSPAFQKGVE